MTDVVEEIRVELENERLGRLQLRPLPVSAILEAFPDELRIARRERNRLRRATEWWIDEHRAIKSLQVPDDQLTFAIEIHKARAPRRKMELLDRLEGLCAAYRVMTRKATGKPVPDSIDAAAVERARAVGIETLYDFVKPRRIGRRFRACCPFHTEATGSFFIFSDNKFKCFGCGERGDAIDFISKTMGMDFIEAVKYLQGRI